MSTATKGGWPQQLLTSSVRSSQWDKLLTHPIYTALNASPESSFSEFGISRAATRVTGLPQLGEEEEAVHGEGGAPREGDEMGLSPLKAQQPGGYSFQTK